MAAKRRRGPAAPRPTKQHQDEASVPEPPRSCATRRGRVVAYLQRSARLSDRLQGLLDPAGQHHRARKRGASQRWRLGTAGLPLEHLRTGVRYDEQRLPQRQMQMLGNSTISPTARPRTARPSLRSPLGRERTAGNLFGPLLSSTFSAPDTRALAALCGGSIIADSMKLVTVWQQRYDS